MSNEKIKTLLESLQDEIRSTDLDKETRAMMKELDADLHELMEAAGESDTESAFDRAQRLETRFAARHPTAERILREIIDTLSGMGV